MTMFKKSMAKKPEIIQLWNPVVCFGRFFGVTPFKRCDREPYFEYCCTFYCWSLVLVSLSVFALVASVTISKKGSVLSSAFIVEVSQYFIYYAHCKFTLLFFLLRYQDFLRLLQQWIDAERFFLRCNIRLGKFTTNVCWFLYAATIILMIGDNASFILSPLLKGNTTNPTDVLNKLIGEGGNFDLYFGKYKYVTGIGIAIVDSLTEVAWITGDFIVAFSSIILHRYYKALHQCLESHGNSCSPRQLEDLRQVHLAVSTLAHRVAEVFSPLILLSVGFNVSYILTFLYMGFKNDLSDPSLLVRFCFTYSFFYLVLRLAFSAYMASRLSEMPGKTVEYLYDQSSLITASADQQRSRLIKLDLIVQQIHSEPVALGGGGFFVLSKASIATLFSLIVTYEVVMLQLPL